MLKFLRRLLNKDSFIKRVNRKKSEILKEYAKVFKTKERNAIRGEKLLAQIEILEEVLYGKS